MGSRDYSKDSIRTRQPVVWIAGHEGLRNYLSHVIKIFGNLGYKLYIGELPENISFDVLWSHQYSFYDPLFSLHLTKLQPYQKVNHIPGSGYYTSKVSLATAGLTFGIPKAFDLPTRRDEFQAYARTHPDRLWVRKSKEHRGIRIRDIKELHFSDNDSFIQEYISRPFLIDNRKFDIGIYTVIASVLPLRVYIYVGDVLLRFCSKDYEPFDADDVDKYVVSDNYTPLWEMPSLKKYYVEQGMTFQHAFNAYIAKLGKDPSLIWDRIKEIIAAVFESQQNKMLAAGANFADKRPFFELSRFDFVLDKDLNVYLMEANMSPNLSSGHFQPNKLLYEQVIINVLSLVGIASHLHGISLEDRFKDRDSQEMLVSDRDLQVFSNDCEFKCFGKDGCKKELKCQLCNHCMNYQLRDILRSAYEEHMSRRNMRRILPRTVHEPEYVSPSYSELDELLTLWFDGKCKDDKTWCI
ncbi:hypothetical protein LOAG_00040 [Loa loa]|uniref:Tubulin polyglutamylase TTLL6 n=1 Tax=Loa loa TaxID=7209 RepID=A0A1I7VE77_LOALO|nr:hypothetical protein LOAG_00040 [Loa loa]EFO28444.1 hypothetical protein LOAG_00040 [Loa loa]